MNVMRRQTDNIDSLIRTVRGQKVILDADLAGIYGVTTKVLNQAVKRNLERFPDDFIFRLTGNELEGLKSQIVTASVKTRKLAAASILLAALFAGTIPATANENPTQTSLNTTSLSGYSDSSIEFQAPVSDRNNGWWREILVWFGFERR